MFTRLPYTSLTDTANESHIMTQQKLYIDVYPPWSPHQGLAAVVPPALFSCASQHNSNVSCPSYQVCEAWHMGTPASSPFQSQPWTGASSHCCCSTHYNATV